MTELIICEKPAQAQKIAESLADKKPKKILLNKVPYYEITHNGKEIIVGCAVGHLYNLAETEKKGWTYPVFDVEWKPAGEVKKSSEFSIKYITLLKKLAKQADEFVVGCDRDAEGSLIGFNVIRFICGKTDGKRMNFSTLTKDELVQSYHNASKHLDFPIIEAGETRHIMDFYYGINLSRALTLAVKSAGQFKILSSGRVQGPTLKIIVDREEEIKNFVPVPFWEIELNGDVDSKKVIAWHNKGKFQEKKEAEAIVKKTKGKKATVISVTKSEVVQKPPTPFDLTTLQTESYKAFGISPKETLSIAQELYTSGLISYPRTSSQKLPISLGFEKILNNLSKNPDYANLCQQLLSKKKLVPNEGEKSDPAHPSIFPTGEKGKFKGEREQKVYDMVVRRFLSTFAEPALRESVTAEIDVNKEIFLAKGVTTKKQGWHEYYIYAVLKEEELPPLKEKQELFNPEIVLHEDQTKPPKRYTPASIIKELDKRNLGTKATRANIVENLYERNYIKEKAIEATTLGIATVNTLKKYCPEILDEQLTRDFEVEMDQIMDEKKHKDEILEHAKTFLTKALASFKKNEKKIGEGLLEATQQTRYEMTAVTKCLNCSEGMMVIRKGRFGNFLACNAYPKCKTTSSLPTGLIKTTENICKECNSVEVLVIRQGKRPFNYCINKQCPAKLRWIEEQKAKAAAAEVSVPETKPVKKRSSAKKVPS
ncbi:MAG TPA: DNA topoisomerase I [Candidatus Nanoarchaeia archaeon]|nr:DNA topoisomerase I [Candidatus Nanoarchaeia archaeon]